MTPVLQSQEAAGGNYVSSFTFVATKGNLSLLEGVTNLEGGLGGLYFYDSSNGSLWLSGLGSGLLGDFPYAQPVTTAEGFLASFSLPNGQVVIEYVTPTSITNVTSALPTGSWSPLTAWGNSVLINGLVHGTTLWWVVNGTTLQRLANVTSDFPATFSWIAGTTETNGTVVITGSLGTSTASQAAFATFNFGTDAFHLLQRETLQTGCWGETLPNLALVGTLAVFGGGRICFVITPSFSVTFNLALVYAVNETTEAVTNLSADLPSSATTVETVAPFGRDVGVEVTDTPQFELGSTPFYTIDPATGSQTNVSSDFPNLYFFGDSSSSRFEAYMVGSAQGYEADLAVVNQTTMAIQERYGPAPPFGTTGTNLVWTDSTVAGGGGYLTVGGNGLTFYNASTGSFQSPSADLGSIGFLQGAAWDGHEFLTVGEDFAPSEGLLAYTYTPNGNNLTEVTSAFPRGLDNEGSGAAFTSVAWNGSSFLVLGQTNASGQGVSQPLFFSFDPTDSVVTNESSIARALFNGSSNLLYSDMLYTPEGVFLYVEGGTGAELWLITPRLGLTNLTSVLTRSGYSFNGSFDSVSGGIHGGDISVLSYNNNDLFLAGTDPTNGSAMVVRFNATLGPTNGTSTIYLPARSDLTTSAFLGADLLLAGWQPTGPGAPNLYAWNPSNGEFENLSGAFPSGFFMPGALAVNGRGGFVSAGLYPRPPLFGVLGTPYNITFQESGLPSGTSWGVDLVGTGEVTSRGTSLQVPETNGTYQFLVQGPANYRPSPGAGDLKVAGAPVVEPITFTLLQYPALFQESGLPSGTAWGIRLLGGSTVNSSSTNLTFDLGNGTYGYEVLSPAGYHPTPSQGNFTIQGAPVRVAIQFTQERYTVTFRATGLPLSTLWGVQLVGVGEANTTTPAVNFSVPNGTYTFRVLSPPGTHVTPSGGNLTVSGIGRVVDLSFSPVTYGVTFTETGLLSGAPWWVNVTGITPLEGNNSAPVVLPLANGSYAYTVGAPPLYRVTPENGTFTVNGSPLTFNVAFQPLSRLEVQVIPAGANVTIGGSPLVPNSSGRYTLELSPGRYYVNATAPGYYPYADLVGLLAGTSTQLTVVLSALPSFGWLAGTVSPVNTTLTVGGHAVPILANGSFNVSLAPGKALLEATAQGHLSVTEEVTITAQRTTLVHLVLSPSSRTAEVQGFVHPTNASVTFNGLAAFSNSSGYYFIWLPWGSYEASFYAFSYLPNSQAFNLTGGVWMNESLTPAPPPSSQVSQGNVSVTGYSVQVNSVSSSTNAVTVNFTASVSGNGTLQVALPFASLANVTLAEILNSTVYINGVRYHNFTISLSSSGEVVLTVTELHGDPTLRWVIGPAQALVPTPVPASSLPGWLLPLAVGLIVVGTVAGVGAWALRRRSRRGSRPKEKV